MINLILSGCGGRMGNAVARLCEETDTIRVVAGIDPLACAETFPFPVFPTPQSCTVPGDVLVDFSSPAALEGLLNYAKSTHIPLVLASTGYDNAQLQAIQAVAQTLPVFRSANLSLGINLLLELTRRAAQVLGTDFDIEIVERHHNHKLDAPSGTALMLADAAKEGLSFSPQYIYDRHSTRAPRDHREIGISTVRGGTIVGDHEVLFAGSGELVELHHHAATRDVFAHGALKAAEFMAHVSTPGMYNMSDVLKSIL